MERLTRYTNKNLPYDKLKKLFQISKQIFCLIDLNGKRENTNHNNVQPYAHLQGQFNLKGVCSITSFSQ